MGKIMIRDTRKNRDREIETANKTALHSELLQIQGFNRVLDQPSAVFR
mgnify:FL=1